MDIQECVMIKKEIYSFLLNFIDSENEEDEKDNYQSLINKLYEYKILESYDEINEFLILINKISQNHQRHLDFTKRIEKIISFFEEKIKQIFTNLQIFNIFRHNKRIILFLFNYQIIQVDKDIIQIITQMNDKKYESYQFYFYKEIKNEISLFDKKKIEDKLLDIDPNIFENFQEKCIIGENDSYLCSLIRNDLIDEFIPYVTRSNISLSRVIDSSIFETNSFLMTMKPSLIEYSAFYGSIEIFQYLRLNNVDINSSIWLYAIHGRNPEIIHLLEDDHIDVEYDKIFEESIKCHHNDFANYFENTYFYNANEKQNSIKKIFNFIKNKIPNLAIECNAEFELKQRLGFKYHNFEFIPDDFNNAFLFKYFCEYNYITFCKLFFKNNMVKVKDKFILYNDFIYKDINHYFYGCRWSGLGQVFWQTI